ncbi:putative MIND kinetochore complex component Mtw1 [Xylariales sp. PMI_506]|nr:putative MIND kinetochore complex component Mtw1 [Xylariales sp. PMI_506]
MTAQVNSDTELLTEHFGYPPVSLIDDIINSINILADRALSSVEQALLNAPPATLGFKASRSSSQRDALDPAEQAKTEIESGTHQLETLMCASIDRNFDILEIYVLRNILCVQPIDIRNYMRLSHYEGLDFSALGANTPGDKPTLESVGLLRKRLRESMRLNALLHAEQQRNAKLLSDLRNVLGVKEETKVKDEGTAEAQNEGPLAFLHQQIGQLKDAGGDTPLSTTTDFTLSQLQALRALSSSLRTMTPHLKPTEEDEPSNSGTKSWRRERLEYVESATRRHLEHVQGLELGKNGEVRDGEWQSEGRKLGKGEVEGLEKVVSLLGEESSSASSGREKGADDMDES